MLPTFDRNGVYYSLGLHATKVMFHDIGTSPTWMVLYRRESLLFFHRE
jgi:hypothetical protein